MKLERPLPAEGQASRITELWAWTALDPMTDVEGIMAARFPSGSMPLVTTMRRLAEELRPVAEDVARTAQEPRPEIRLRRFVPADE